MKKVIALTLSFCLLFGSTPSIFANENLDFNQRKNIITNLQMQNKLLDIDQYEKDLKNARTSQEIININKKYDRYFTTDKVEYLGNIYDSKSMKSKDNDDEPREGDVRYVTNKAYGHKVTYDEIEKNNLLQYGKLTLDVCSAFFKPAIGLFYFVIGKVINEDDFYKYTNVLTKVEHDSLLIRKNLEVYVGHYAWGGEDWRMLRASQQKTTYADVNTRYWLNGQRQTPVIKDLGKVKVETAPHYWNLAEDYNSEPNLYGMVYYIGMKGTHTWVLPDLDISID